MNKTDLLSRVSVFFLMKKEDLQRIAELAQYHLFHEGDVIIREGDHSRQLFIIVSGKVEIIKDLGGKNERRLRIFGPHSYFGEMALIDGLVRSASVVAKKDTQVLSLDQLNLRQEIEKYPTLAIELLQMLSRRVRAIEKSMINTLGAYLPVCANCKNIREVDGSWTPIEEYIADHSETEFSHSFCPECLKKLYPEYYKDD
ncbi:MAG: cyclic nucleotide-binding domain-containing protein [Desulfobacterales bacterium]|nr:cyclic nucleotide-binding domain-containing protein [Desulfobacterales bacterium]